MTDFEHQNFLNNFDGRKVIVIIKKNYVRDYSLYYSDNTTAIILHKQSITSSLG